MKETMIGKQCIWGRAGYGHLAISLEEWLVNGNRRNKLGKLEI